MKKSIKIISLLIIVALIAVLSLSLVACNGDKDTYETIKIENEEEVRMALDDVCNNTSNVSNFEIKIESDGVVADYIIMAVKNKSMLKGTLNGTDVFLGKFYLDKEEEVFETKGNFYAYDKEDESWVDGIDYFELTCEYESEAQMLNDCLSCYDPATLVEEFASNINYINLEISKIVENGTLITGYECKATVENVQEDIEVNLLNNSVVVDSIEFTTTRYNDLIVLKTFKYTAGEITVSFTYDYGQTFEIPEK